jgi:competence protein ComEC
VLVDGGGAALGLDVGARAVVPTLRALGVRRIDLLVASHADLDHRGGLPAVLAALPVGEIWVPATDADDAGFAAVRAAAAADGVPVRARGAGDPPARAGDLAVRALWPPREVAWHARVRERNDRSLVIHVAVEGRSVLVPGDLEAAGEAALLAGEAALDADVLALGHHGSRSSSTAAFLRAVGARVAVASAPCAGRFGMPHAEAVQRVADAGASLWWTGRDGAVIVGLGERLGAVGWASPPARCRP